jgi:hypothetical protein
LNLRPKALYFVQLRTEKFVELRTKALHFVQLHRKNPELRTKAFLLFSRAAKILES